MKFLLENWFMIILFIACLTIAGYNIYVFLNRPSTEQLNKVKEWLLYAVTEAERKLGSGTGKIKLRYVYDMFLVKFPYLANVIPFESFSFLVDESLEQFRILIDSNSKVKDYIETKEG